ncbi:MAG: inositol monophosphatase [Bacteroidetes bacterium]|nr:inositol monophosphatase [Bacteroidota bacterium]
MLDIKHLGPEVCEIVRESSRFIKSEYNKLSHNDIQFKDRNELLSYVDIETEEFLISKLSALIPSSNFLAEESSPSLTEQTDEILWIIDPLDGTTNYIHQIPTFSISVALMMNKKIIMGIVYELMQDEMFYAREGANSMLNDKEIRVSSNNEMQHALIGTGFPIKDFEIKESYVRIFSELLEKTRGLRRIGSAAVDLAYVACGRFDAFFEYNLNPWDVAAGSFIVKQAGGKVSDFSGGPDYLFGKQMLATSSSIYDELLKEIIALK